MAVIAPLQAAPQKLVEILMRWRASTPGLWSRVKNVGARYWTIGRIVDHVAEPLESEENWQFIEHANRDLLVLMAHIAWQEQRYHDVTATLSANKENALRRYNAKSAMQETIDGLREELEKERACKVSGTREGRVCSRLSELQAARLVLNHPATRFDNSLADQLYVAWQQISDANVKQEEESERLLRHSEITNAD